MSGEQKEVRLREVFQDEHFSETDLARILNLSSSNAHYFRYKLLKQKKIARVGRGLYKLASSNCSSSELRCEPVIEYIRSSLLQLNLNFSITSCSFFNKFYPLYNYIIIYIEKGTANSFLRYLPTLNLDHAVLLDPEKKDIELLRDAAHKRNFILVREKAIKTSSAIFNSSAIPSSSALKGIADMEHAFVDYYFEVTRNKLPLDNKSKEILDYLLLHYTLNFSKLLRYAKERGIRKEMEALFENISFLKKKISALEEKNKMHEHHDDDKIQHPKIGIINIPQGDHNE